MSKLKANLSSQGIRNLISKVKLVKEGVVNGYDEYARRLAEQGYEAAIAAVPVDTGELRDSIAIEKLGKGKYRIIATAEHALFVEFGTGVVGEGTYPDKKRLREAGWRYRMGESANPEAHDPDNPEFWYWLGDDGRYHRTNGRQAAGFLLAGAEAMKQNRLRVAKEVFKNARL